MVSKFINCYCAILEGCLLTLFLLVPCRLSASIEIYENEPKGHFITNLAQSELATSTGKKPSQVTIQSDLVNLERNWDLVTSKSLDREAICPDISNNCEANVLIFTSNPFKSEKIVLRILDRNDNSPKFARDTFQMNMPENTPVGGNWALDIAKDPDSVENGVVSYSLLCVDCDEDALGIFQLNDDERRSSDGAVLPKLKLLAPLDHELNKIFKLKVTAKDKDGNSDFYYVMINVTDINDNAPVFSQSTLKLIIPEDQPVGSVVGNVYATDEDSGRNGQIEYGFSTQESLPETVRCFSIDKHTGEITLVQSLKNQGGKNHEVIIYAKDKALSPMKDELTWTFSILEKNDFVPQINFISFEESEDCEIPENSNEGHVIGYFEVTDKDEGVFGETEFLMVNGSNLFELKEENGFYFVSLPIRFDRELQDQYVITVRALDCKGDATCDRLESTIPMVFRVCDENDNEPVFVENEIILTITEESVPGFLAKFEAFDKDKGPNGEVEFFIPQVAVSGSFYVDSSTGSVSSVLPLDRERLGNVVEVPIAARDKGIPMRTTRARLIINLVDINDNPPRFLHNPKFLETFENSNPGMVIGTVEAVDDDTENADIVYSLTSNSSKLFEIGKHQGKISTLETFDYEDKNNREFNIWVVAKEDTEGGLQSVLPLVVKVIDRNDNYPVIDYIEKFVEVPWDADDGFEVTHVLAHDDDSNENGRLRFRLLTEDMRFDINSKTGLLYVRERQQSLYSDKDETFEVVVEVQDCASIDSLSVKDSMFVTFSGNVTLYNHTLVPAINIPMTLSDIEGFIIHIAIGAVVLFIIIIILFVLLIKKCSRNNQRGGVAAHHLSANGKLMRPEDELQFNTRRSLGGAGGGGGGSGGHHLQTSTLLQHHTYHRGGGTYQPSSSLGSGAASVPPHYLSTCSNVDSSSVDDFCSSKDVSPNSITAHLVDDSVVFANEMHRGSITNIHENPLAVTSSSAAAVVSSLLQGPPQSQPHPPSHVVSSSTSSLAGAAATTFSPQQPSHPAHQMQQQQLPSPLPKLKLEIQTSGIDPCPSGPNTSIYSSPTYSYVGIGAAGSGGGDNSNCGSSSSTLSKLHKSATPTCTTAAAVPPSSRRQISEPVDPSSITAPNLHTQHYPLPTDIVGSGGMRVEGGNRRQLNALPNCSSSDVRSSGSPEPAGSDSSSFDSGRGSEAQMDPLTGGLGAGPFHPQTGQLISTIRGVKSLPSGKKSSSGSRHVAPSPMFGDYREDDCWQPRTTTAASTLPSSSSSSNPSRQLNNPDIPTKGGILITPARQILQPPASNHEKWNLPREGNTFKQSAGTPSGVGVGAVVPGQQMGGASSPCANSNLNNSSSSSSSSSNPNATINRNGSTCTSELEPIAENFAMAATANRQQTFSMHNPGQQQQQQISPTQSLMHMQNYALLSGVPVSGAPSTGSSRSSLPPKRTPPSIPIDPNSQSESRTAVV